MWCLHCYWVIGLILTLCVEGEMAACHSEVLSAVVTGVHNAKAEECTTPCMVVEISK